MLVNISRRSAPQDSHKLKLVDRGAIVTTRRLRDLRRLLEAEAEAYGAAVRIEQTNGNHLKAIFNVANRQVFIITPWSPGSRFVHRYVRADARRALRALST